MNELINVTGTIAMSSREIAELCEKEHKNVMADIRGMLEELGETSAKFSADLPDAYGRAQPCFNLPKDLTITLVSGYNVKLRKRIIDRWIELERKPTAVNLRDPKQMAGLAVQLLEFNQELQAKVEADRPKVEFHDHVASAINCQGISEIAKVLGFGPHKLFRVLYDKSILMRKNRLPYQQHIDAGYFEVVERDYPHPVTGEPVFYPQAVVTGKGLIWLQQKLKGVSI